MDTPAPTNPLPIQPKKPKKKLIFLLLIFILIIAYFFFYHPSKTANQQLIYTNAYYQFSFKYPNNLEPDESRSINPPAEISIDFYTKEDVPTMIWSAVTSLKNASNEEKELKINQNNSNPTWFQYTIDGEETLTLTKNITAKIFKIKVSASNAGGYYQAIIPLNQNSSLILLSGTLDKTQFDQILSTLQLPKP